MTLEEEIAALSAEAAPLRCLPDDEAEAAGLQRIISDINALRALQEKSPYRVAVVAPEPDPEAPKQTTVFQLPKRRPGRPRKVA